MLWLLLGGLALAFFLLSANRIASVDPRFLAQGVRWGGVAALAAASLVLLRSGRWALFLTPSLQRMMRRAFARAASPSPRSTSGPSQDTVVETATVRMRLNHASGTLDGDVLSGPHRGRRLGELEVAVVIALRDVCRRDDPDAVPCSTRTWIAATPIGAMFLPTTGTELARPANGQDGCRDARRWKCWVWPRAPMTTQYALPTTA